MFENTISDVFFDLDHTLWDFEKNSALAFERIFKKRNLEINPVDFILVYNPVNAHYWKMLRENKISHSQLRQKRLIDSFKKFDLSFSADLIDRLAIDYIEELPRSNYLLSDALSVLEYLSGKYRLHIITNGFREVQLLKLQQSGIDFYFQTITSFEDAGVRKPDSQIFHQALQKAGVRAEFSMMIGDNWEADIMGAKQAGMQAIYFNKEKPLHDSVVHVDQLLQIKNFL